MIPDHFVLTKLTEQKSQENMMVIYSGRLDKNRIDKICGRHPLKVHSQA